MSITNVTHFQSQTTSILFCDLKNCINTSYCSKGKYPLLFLFHKNAPKRQIYCNTAVYERPGHCERQRAGSESRCLISMFSPHLHHRLLIQHSGWWINKTKQTSKVQRWTQEAPSSSILSHQQRLQRHRQYSTLSQITKLRTARCSPSLNSPLAYVSFSKFFQNVWYIRSVWMTT